MDNANTWLHGRLWVGKAENPRAGHIPATTMVHITRFETIISGSDVLFDMHLTDIVLEIEDSVTCRM